MSVIALGAQSFLERQGAWQDREAAEKLSLASDDQLKALLMMAVAEGQPQVEQWVRDEMASRGIRPSSRRASLQFQSRMDARDWLEKAMVLVLAGGILLGGWGGGSLPVVDQSSGHQPPAVTQQYEVTQDQQTLGHITVVGELPDGLTMQEIMDMSDAVVNAGGVEQPIIIDFSGEGIDGVGGAWYGTGKIVVRPWLFRHPEAGKSLLLHEITHLFDNSSGHSQEWGEIYYGAAKDILSPSGAESVLAKLHSQYGLTIEG